VIEDKPCSVDYNVPVLREYDISHHDSDGSYNKYNSGSDNINSSSDNLLDELFS